VHGRLIEQMRPMDHGTTLGIIRGPDQATDPGVADRACAHRAGFQGHVQRQAGQAIIVTRGRGSAQGHDLGMSGGIVPGHRAVGPHRDDLSRRLVDHDSAHGNLTGCCRRLRKVERHAHEPLIMARHTDDNDKKPRPSQAPRAHKPGDRPKGGSARPGSASAAQFQTASKSPEGGRGSGSGRAYPADKGARPEPRPKAPRAGARPAGKDAKAPAEPKRSERIAKAMARAGIASRREVERLIGLGKVAVNGRILETPATLVTRDDIITVNGKPIAAAQPTRVWRYNKPVGLLTSHNDPQGRPTVFDALPSGLPRVISVGRLDISTEGLLLLTNDGELSRALELPETALVRQYRARARGRITQAELDRLKDGVTVDGVRYGPVEATIDKATTKEDGSQAANLWISVQIAEGKNREVRKVLESVGLTVNRLIRLAYGPFQLGTLAVGSVEEIGPRVIRELLGAHIRPDNLPEGNAVAGPRPPRRTRAAPPPRSPSSHAKRQDQAPNGPPARSSRATTR